MQEQSAARLSLPKRLEALRLAKQLTWDGLAEMLEISPSMVYQVKRGERSLGDLVMHRLEEAEISEGLLSVQDASFARLLRSPNAVSPLASTTVETGENASHNEYIKMRLEVVADLIDTYDSNQMQVLIDQLDKLTKADKVFGKVFDQIAELVSHLRLRKEQRENAARKPKRK